MLLALLAPALAADLDVRITTPSDRVVHLTVHDFDVNGVPELTVPDTDIHVTIEATRVEAGQWTLAFTLAAAKVQHGRVKSEVIASPRVTTLAGEPATVEQGWRFPVGGTEPLEYREAKLTIETVVKE